MGTAAFIKYIKVQLVPIKHTYLFLRTHKIGVYLKGQFSYNEVYLAMNMDVYLHLS